MACWEHAASWKGTLAESKHKQSLSQHHDDVGNELLRIVKSAASKYQTDRYLHLKTLTSLQARSFSDAGACRTEVLSLPQDSGGLEWEPEASLPLTRDCSLQFPTKPSGPSGLEWLHLSLLNTMFVCGR